MSASSISNDSNSRKNDLSPQAISGSHVEGNEAELGDESDGIEHINYGNKCEVLLALVGLACGLGNLWRFPYLAWQSGGGAFLIPYFLANIFLAFPILVLEMGIGQCFRINYYDMWTKMGLPRMRGLGVAGVCVCYFLGISYVVVLSWVLYYLVRLCIDGVRYQTLPWSDKHPNWTCPDMTFIIDNAYINNPGDLFTDNGFFNQDFRGAFYCPGDDIPRPYTPFDNTTHFMYSKTTTICPTEAGVSFWEVQTLQRTSGMDEIGGMNLPLFGTLTVAWLIVFAVVSMGAQTIGKAVYVTATAPYICLLVLFINALTLPNMQQGFKFFWGANFDRLSDGQVWVDACTQILYSLSICTGAIPTITAYSPKQSNFQPRAVIVTVLNAATSLFSGCVVFPMLGYLAYEMSLQNPCILKDDLNTLAFIGLSGPGLVFMAVPTAIAMMPVSFLWAFIFFITLLLLGMDSEIGLCETISNVLSETVEVCCRRVYRPLMAFCVCVVMWLSGLLFVTKGGFYWFSMVDTYAFAFGLFFIGALESVGVFWVSKNWRALCKNGCGAGLGIFFCGDSLTYARFQKLQKLFVGTRFWPPVWFCVKFLVPIALAVVCGVYIAPRDLLGAEGSVPYNPSHPGSPGGYYPKYANTLGWLIAAVPALAFVVFVFLPLPKKQRELFYPKDFTFENRERKSSDEAGEYAENDEDEDSEGSAEGAWSPGGPEARREEEEEGR